MQSTVRSWAGGLGADLVQAPNDQQLLLLVQLRVRVVHVRALTLQGSRRISPLAPAPTCPDPAGQPGGIAAGTCTKPLTGQHGWRSEPCSIQADAATTACSNGRTQSLAVRQRRARTRKGAANHSSKLSAQSNTAGSTKLSSAQSSARLFWIGVPVSSTRWRTA